MEHFLGDKSVQDTVLKNLILSLPAWELQSCKGERELINDFTSNYLFRVVISLLNTNHLAREVTLLGSERVSYV